MSDTMFESVISPAYFSSRLETPLGIIKSIFRDQSPWGNTTVGAERMETFLGSEIFSDLYFRHLMGVFMCNVLHVRIEAVVDRSGTNTPMTPENEVEKRGVDGGIGEEEGGGEGGGGGGGGEVDAEIVQGLKELLVGVEKGEGVGVEGGGGEKGVEDISVAPILIQKKALRVKKNYGVGLFYIYSKLNHSCECNTVNQGGSEAEVSLIATVDILQGGKYVKYLYFYFSFFIFYYVCFLF